MDSAQTKLQNWLQENLKHNGICITKKENITWLTGFSGSFGIFIGQKKGKNFLISDGRYEERAKKYAKESGAGFILWDTDFSKKFGAKMKGDFAIEDSISVGKLKQLKKDFLNVKFTPQNGVLETLRNQKTREEIAKIKKAQAQVDKVLLQVLHDNLRVGITEKELEFKLEMAIRDGGKFDLSFESIVAFGPNSAIPHHASGSRKLKKGDNILIDCGAKFEGYCSDMTRNFGFGDVSAEFQNKYDLLRDVQEKILAQYKVGAKPKDLDAACRKLLGKETEFFTHTLGHGVGLEIHELPTLSKKSKIPFTKNEVVTCEPGIYYPGKFGIRIEDLVVIGGDEPEVLSTTTKDFVVFDF